MYALYTCYCVNVFRDDQEPALEGLHLARQRPSGLDPLQRDRVWNQNRPTFACKIFCFDVLAEGREKRGMNITMRINATDLPMVFCSASDGNRAMARKMKMMIRKGYKEWG